MDSISHNGATPPRWGSIVVLVLFFLAANASLAPAQRDSAAISRTRADSVAARTSAPTLTELIGTRFPGATTIRPNGLPGIGGLIRIRGRRSLALTNDPEISIDGVLMPSRTPLSGLAANLVGDQASLLDLLAPEDIEHLEIDPSLNSGLRAGGGLGNGVIRITTRRGNVGRPQWSAAAEVGAATDPQQYPAIYFTQGYSVPYGSCTLSDQAAGACRAGGVSSRNAATDPATTVLGTGLHGHFSLAVRGGGERVRYAVSGNLTRDRGVFSLPPGERNFLSAKLGTVPGERIHPSGLTEASGRANLDLTVTRLLTIRFDGSTVLDRPRLPFNTSSHDESLAPLVTGTPADTADPFHNVLRPALLYEVGTARRLSRTAASIRADWHPGPALRGWASAAVMADRLTDRSSASDTTFSQRDSTTYRDNRLDAEAGIATSLTWGTGAFTGSAAAQFRRGRPTFRGLHQVINNGATSEVSAGSSAAYQTLGAVLTGDLDLGRRFRLGTTIRRDQPRVADVAQRPLWGAGVSGRWTGPIPIHGAWSRLQRDIGASGPAVFVFDRPPTEEEVSEIELGLDLSFWQRRGRISLTGYRQSTRNGLLSGPFFDPFNLVFIGGGVRIRNQGLEFLLSARVLSHSSTTLDLDLAGATLASRIVASDRILLNTVPCNLVDAAPFSVCGYPTPRFRDLNGDGIILESELDPLAFRIFGPTLPRATVGAGFDVATSMSGGVLSVTGRIDYLGGQWSNNSALKAQCVQGLCRAVNDPTTSLADQAAAVARGFVGAYAASSSFARLRELGVTWRTRGRAARAVGAKSLTLAITGRNLALISGFKGWDPEVQTLASDLAARQLFPVPLPRAVTFRLAVGW